MIKTIEIKSTQELAKAISKEIKKSRKSPTEILKRAGRNKQYLGRLNNGTAKEIYVSSLIGIFQELGFHCFLVPKRGDEAATIYHITISDK